ncbi:hypothetical protein C8J56DRAFT_915760 [Mycena floridula]|nr:hypothetical protein C8J56DRAFT_915760 [Mycena floridula]
MQDDATEEQHIWSSNHQSPTSYQQPSGSLALDPPLVQPIPRRHSALARAIYEYDVSPADEAPHWPTDLISPNSIDTDLGNYYRGSSGYSSSCHPTNPYPSMISTSFDYTSDAASGQSDSETIHSPNMSPSAVVFGPHSGSDEPTASVTPKARRRNRSGLKPHCCEICSKSFARPSGLQTHMNTHNNIRPFKCPMPGCKRSFTVRSNAKRHLKTTHGPAAQELLDLKPDIFDRESPSISTASCSQPSSSVAQWIPSSLSNSSNVTRLRQAPESGDEFVDDVDDNGYYLTLPLRPSIPTLTLGPQDDGYEERNSYIEASLFPYHPAQFTGLPGPALALHRRTTTV